MWPFAIEQNGSRRSVCAKSPFAKRERENRIRAKQVLLNHNMLIVAGINDIFLIC